MIMTMIKGLVLFRVKHLFTMVSFQLILSVLLFSMVMYCFQ